MKQFSIVMHSFADIHEFVSLSAQQPFDVTVGDENISGKSLLAMLSLNICRPLLVRVNCDDDDFLRFQSAAARFIA